MLAFYAAEPAYTFRTGQWRIQSWSAGGLSKRRKYLYLLLLLLLGAYHRQDVAAHYVSAN